jgi:HD-GYP domain-containing protein (c-di-GMP phosphodiesterase class II)
MEDALNAYARRRVLGPGALGRRGAALLVALLAGPAVLLMLARSLPVLDPVFESVRFHLFVVSTIAGLALLVAMATAIAAGSDGRPAPVLLALGCVCVGFLMLAHGLTTPGIFGRPMNLWVGRLGTLALAGFALCLGAAAWRRGPIARAVARAPRAALVVPIVLIGIACTVIAAAPTSLWGTHPVPAEEQIRSLIQGVSVFVLLLAGTIHWRRWRLGRDRVELSLVLASWLSMSGIISLAFGVFWHLSWWDYHLYLLSGFAACCWAVATEYRRSRSLATVVAGIAAGDPVEQVSRGHPEALDALIGAVEAKDPYTSGHSERVAELATRIGLRLGLSPEALRALHQGASLHDVGKISVPDQVLNKPGELTSGEWVWIERHPTVGWELASRARSLRESLEAIRSHHERWDGSGYPDHLAAETIPLSGRIVAVADVWDALTSERAYRAAWPFDRAISHVAAAAGILFDPRCVEAFLDVLADSGLAAEATRPELEALVRSAGECHAVSERRRRPPRPRAKVRER